MEDKNILKLADLCKKVKNGASSFYLRDGTVPLKIIRHADVGEDGAINIASVERVMARDSARTVENLLKAGDVLVSIRGPMKVAIVPKEAEGYSFAAEFIALEIDADRMNPEIIAAYLRMPHVNAYLESRAPAKAMRSISPQQILDLEIGVSDPEKQKKIVELISLIGEQELVIGNIMKELLDLKHAMLLQLFGGIRK